MYMMNMATQSGVLTTQGKIWIDEMASYISDHRDWKSRSYAEELEYHNLDWIRSGGRLVCPLPLSAPDGTTLHHSSGDEFILKICSPDWIGKPSNTTCSDRNPFYVNEVFGEVRTWLEACERGVESLFAEVIEWDQSNGKWMIQRKATDVSPAHGVIERNLEEKLKDTGDWYVDDAEVGKINDDYVFTDFGEFWVNDWKIAESSVVPSI